MSTLAVWMLVNALPRVGMCVAVCCSMLRCVAVWFWNPEYFQQVAYVLQCVAVCCVGIANASTVVCCSVWQCVAVCVAVWLQCVLQCCTVKCVVEQVRCAVLHNVSYYCVVCYSVLQCVAVCCVVIGTAQLNVSCGACMSHATNMNERVTESVL